MAVRRRRAAHLGILALSALTLASPPAAARPNLAQLSPALPDQPPGPFTPDATPDLPAPAAEPSDTWIFSGTLQSSHEEFSGTLVTGKAQVQFELKLAGGATCDGADLVAGIGLVRLPDITCTDERTMRALFVPQGGEALRVFGHIGDERFVTTAHLLGDKPIPEKGQTAEPKAPRARPLPDVPPDPAEPPPTQRQTSPDPG